MTLSSCQSSSWDIDSRLRFWEKEFLEGERAMQKHKYTDALDSFSRAAVEAKSISPENVHLAFSLDQLGKASLATKNYPEAEKQLSQALKIYEQCASQPTNTASVNQLIMDGMAGALTGLGVVEMSKSKFPEAEKVLVKALGIYDKLANSTKSGTSTVIQDQLECKSELADAYLAQGKLELAEPLFLNLIKTIPYCISQSELKKRAINNYAKLLRLTGRKRESLDFSSQQKNSPADLNWQNSYAKAVALTNKRAFEKAEIALTQALEAAAQIGAQSNEMSSTLRELADLYLEEGRNTEAWSAAQRALAIKHQELGAADNEVERDFLTLIRISVAQKNWNTAADLLKTQYELERKNALQRPIQRAENRAWMAYINHKLGKEAEADKLIDESTILSGENKRPRIARVLTVIAQIYEDRTEYPKAQKLYESALAINRAFGADKRLLTPKILLSLGNSYSGAGLDDKARSCYYQALALLTERKDPLVANLLANYAICEFKSGKKSVAAKLAHEAEQSMPNFPNATHEEFDAAMATYKKLVGGN